MNPFHSKNRLLLMAMAALSLALIGCAAIKSTRSDLTKPGSGLAYYLPKGMVRLVVVKEVVVPEPLLQVPPVRTNSTLTNLVMFQEVATNKSVLKFTDNGGLDLDLKGDTRASNVVTQLFAVGSDRYGNSFSFANPIAEVLSSLNVDIV